MAHKMNAINAFRPRLEKGLIVDMEELEARICSRTTFNEGLVHNVLMELKNTVIHSFASGRSVKMLGLGIYTPEVNLEGKFQVSHRMENQLKKTLNDGRMLRCKIKNRDLMGKTVDDLIAKWNEENPGDLVVTTP